MPKLAKLTKRAAASVPTGKLRPLNIRTTAEIRQRLEEAARRSGRSLTQEVERRFERSFDREDELGDPRAAEIAHWIFAIGRRYFPDWTTNRKSFNKFVALIPGEMRSLAPPVPPEWNETIALVEKHLDRILASDSLTSDDRYRVEQCGLAVEDFDAEIQERLRPKFEKARDKLREAGL